jgi:hypothetical protein
MSLTPQDLEECKNFAKYIAYKNNAQTVAYEKQAYIWHARLISRRRRAELKKLENYHSYVNTFTNSPDFPNVHIQDYLQYLTPGQHEIITSFLETGNLVITAENLKINYNTAKAQYRHAILLLRTLIHDI